MVPEPDASPQSTASPGDGGSGARVVIGGVGHQGYEDVAAVVASMRPGFRRCYERSLASNPNQGGALRVTVRIGPSGEVLSATATGSGYSSSLLECLEGRARKSRFPPPEGGAAVIVIPLTLLP
ncbi:MAG: AgmX/PglI C-terminal domain-containing protein [Polyangiaceae bacterium]